jgi:hypothetical protein
MDNTSTLKRMEMNLDSFCLLLKALLEKQDVYRVPDYNYIDVVKFEILKLTLKI